MFFASSGHCSVQYQIMAGSNFVGNLRLAAVETGAEKLAGLNCCS
jgi:hypothetical protein